MILPNILGKEFECINKISRSLPSLGLGDDCAIIAGKGKKLVISTDYFVEGVHFDTAYFKLEQIGERCSEAAISDIAAMGARPLYLLLSLSVPKTYLIQKLVKGIKTSLDRNKIKLIGGDTTKSNTMFLNITVIGETSKPIKRNGAKPGDLIYITSYTGLSAAGLYAINNDIKGFNILKKTHKLQTAKIKEGLRLNSIATAMIDISDGLASELYHLAYASKCDMIIEQLPIHKELITLCKKAKLDPIDFVLYGGEDYELLYTIDPRFKDKAIGIKIGLVTGRNKNPSIEGIDLKRGFRHF